MNQDNMNNIRKAILKYRGGFQNATDAQLLRLWRLLPADVQKQYMDSIQTKTKKTGESLNATGARPKTEIPGSSGK